MERKKRKKEKIAIGFSLHHGFIYPTTTTKTTPFFFAA
jgi:hypothetical protein